MRWLFPFLDAIDRIFSFLSKKQEPEVRRQLDFNDLVSLLDRLQSEDWKVLQIEHAPSARSQYTSNEYMFVTLTFVRRIK